MSSERQPLDTSLLAEEPARDSRFQVAERWVDCANFPEDDPRRQIDEALLRSESVLR